MLKLSEWLTRVGFQRGNPFALKEADHEGDFLQQYFFEHPAYNQLLDVAQSASGILAAPRGAGKSSIRRMFAANYANPIFEQRILLIPFTDWMPLATTIDQPDFINAFPHIEEIARLIVPALAQSTELSWIKSPASPDLRWQLNQLCIASSDYLMPSEYERLEDAGWIIPSTHNVHQVPRRLPSVMQLDSIARLLLEMGFRACYILIDRIDELAATTADWERCAQMIAPLICNVRLNEISGLSFKYFLPYELVTVLLQSYGLRTDRILFANLYWEEAQLLKLLEMRLSSFSDGFIPRLAALAPPTLHKIDEQIVRSANGSPRNLLNLGDWLFQACAASATDNELQILPVHLRWAQAQLQRWLQSGSTSFAGSRDLDSHTSTSGTIVPVDLNLSSTTADLSSIPLLRLLDGVIWRGDTILDGWENLPPMQLRLLQYLYDKRGKVCNKEAIIAHVWAGKAQPAGDDSLRKLAERLIEFIEPDPVHPVYIQKIRGGHYRLDNSERI